ncbi:MAG: hypothetical protein N3A01_00985 [Bacteroidales bacterium]|nr:hypothetical protein [Bacteroidales bacterium]
MKQIIKLKILIFKVLSIVYIISSLKMFCQSDTILFLTGQKIYTNEVVVDEEEGIVKFKNKRGKEKVVPIDAIYSITNKNGSSKVFFEPRVIGKIPFNKDQMYDFIKGEMFSEKMHKTTVPFTTGLLVGSSSIFFSMYFLGTPFYSPILPSTVIFITGILPINEKKIKKIVPEVNYQNDYFILGYKEMATDKNIKASIKGSLIGFVLGLAGSIVAYNACR